MAKRKLGVRAKAKKRVQNAVNRLSKNGYVFNQSFIEKIHNPKTHFEKIDINKIYAQSTKGGVKGTVARAQERSERARRAARTRKERQQNKLKIPDTIDIVRDVLHGLRENQYFYGMGITDVSTYKADILSFFDKFVDSRGVQEYSQYLESVGEYLMSMVNDANNSFYWEEYQSALSEIMTVLKGSALTLEESIEAESMGTENTATYYEEEEEEDFEDNQTDYEYMGSLKDSHGNRVDILRDKLTGNFFRGDTLSPITMYAEEEYFEDDLTGEKIRK